MAQQSTMQDSIADASADNASERELEFQRRLKLAREQAAQKKNPEQTVERAGTAVQAVGRGTEVAGAGIQASGKGVEVAGQATEVAGKGIDVGGKAVSAAGKGMERGGAAMVRAGAAMSGTVAGAVVGVPLAVAGGVTAAAGGVADVGGKGVQAAGKGTQAAGKGIRSAGVGLQDAGMGIKNTGKGMAQAGGEMKSMGQQAGVMGPTGAGGPASFARRLRDAKEKAKETAGGSGGVVSGVSQAAGKKVFAQMLAWSWRLVLPSFGLTAIYLNAHAVARYLMHLGAFCSFGEEWSFGSKGGGGMELPKEVSKNLEKVEIMGLVFIDIIILILLVIVFIQLKLMTCIATDPTKILNISSCFQ